MAGYELNKQHAYSQVDFDAALKWEDAQRNTQRIRDRVQELQQVADLNCCWSIVNLRLTMRFHLRDGLIMIFGIYFRLRAILMQIKVIVFRQN
ncbi:hypothetical protein [Shewanella mangrovisoli]|uniref:hypothetical protein n=1 Tax=Shewanella mangrovisoli TaxID=2864211 RepID=UPI0035BB874B